jgi:hypothetical protein
VKTQIAQHAGILHESLQQQRLRDLFLIEILADNKKFKLWQSVPRDRDLALDHCAQFGKRLALPLQANPDFQKRQNVPSSDSPRHSRKLLIALRVRESPSKVIALLLTALDQMLSSSRLISIDFPTPLFPYNP